MAAPIMEGPGSEQEILVQLKEVIAKIVMIKPEEIADNAILTDDLGLESIDLLDLNFRLEEIFGIVLPPKNPIQRFTDRLGQDQFIENGVVTPKGIRFLEMIFPGVERERLQNVLATGIMSLISVQTYVNLIKRCMEMERWKPADCPQCQGALFTTVAKEQLEFHDHQEVPIGPVYQCVTCHFLLYPPTFDEKVMRQLEATV